MEITLGDATKLLDNIMANYSQWHTERSTNKKVHAIEEINVLSGKLDELMKLFATKSVSSDPNDMPLSTLIENNNESMDVNFVGRNNFGNNAYRGNFNPRPYPSNPSNNYGNSKNNSYGNYVGERSRILKFSTHHQDQSMESSSNEGERSASTDPCRSRMEAFKRTGLMESYSS